MNKILKLATKLDNLGNYKIADKLYKQASIYLFGLKLKEDLEDGVRALYNYYDERTLTNLLKLTNILLPDGDVSSHPFDYNELIKELNNIETTSPSDLPTNSGNNNYNSLNDLKENILQNISMIDKFQISLSNAHDTQREQQKEIQKLQGDIIPDEW